MLMLLAGVFTRFIVLRGSGVASLMDLGGWLTRGSVSSDVKFEEPLLGRLDCCVQQAGIGSCPSLDLLLLNGHN